MLDLIFIEYVKVVKTGVSKVYKRFKLKIRILKLILPFSYLSSNINESKYKILSPTKLMQGTWSQLILVDCIWFGFYFDFIYLFIFISNGRYILKKNTAPYIGNVLDRQKHQETKLQ